MKIVRWVAAVGLMIAAVGCGQAPVSDSETTPEQTGPTVARESHGDARTPAEDRDSFVPQPIVNAPAAKLPVRPDSLPEEVVTEFLNAMKTGNDGVAAGLLTALARTETAKHDLAVQPPGSTTAEYEVTAGEIAADDPALAQVGCVWIERDDAGAEHSEEAVWFLRKQPEGWRVCGMALQIPTREEPLVFDFEDGAAMIALIEEVSQAMAAATNETSSADDSPTIREASKTGDSENSLRK